MMSLSRQLSIFVIALGIAACGGVSEERVAALESQLRTLQDQQSKAQAAAPEKKTDAAAAESNEAIKKLEEMVEVLQREVTNLSTAKASPAPAAAAAGASKPALAEVIDVALGVPAEAAIKLDGDVYKLQSGWLVEQLRLAAAGNKLPKLAPEKKKSGLAVRGIKPKSLVEQLGFKNNDIIVAVGDKPTPGITELAAALKAAGSNAAIKVVRKNEELVLKYSLAD